MQSIAGSFSVYVERRMARILLLGVISGFPWVLIGSALSLWLKEDGLSRTAIGWAGLIFGVYAVNFLWAPLIDRLRVPLLTDRFGHRRAWIVTLQAVILACLVLWSVIEPTANLAVVVAVGLAIATASATQDITIDALRIEQVGESEGESMASTNLLFAVLAWTGKSAALFAAAVVVDDLTSAFATVTFVAFISMLVDRTYTATQYALLASIGTAGRTLFAASSGALVDWLDGDWGVFFVITALMVIPSLVCLWAIRGRLGDILAGAGGQRLGKDRASDGISA